MKKIIVYGIPNCDMIKKTLLWFKNNNINVEFHDYKNSGITKDKLAGWIKKAGLEIILNKRSTTWRELPVKEQQKINGPIPAIRLMMENTSIIKRPLIEYGDKVFVGSDETAYLNYFLNQGKK